MPPLSVAVIVTVACPVIFIESGVTVKLRLVGATETGGVPIVKEALLLIVPLPATMTVAVKFASIAVDPAVN